MLLGACNDGRLPNWISAIAIYSQTRRRSHIEEIKSNFAILAAVDCSFRQFKNLVENLIPKKTNQIRLFQLQQKGSYYISCNINRTLAKEILFSISPQKKKPMRMTYAKCKIRIHCCCTLNIYLPGRWKECPRDSRRSSGGPSGASGKSAGENMMSVRS